MERVEGVEKLLLHGLFLGDKLHVVDEQHVDIAIALAKFETFVQLDCGDKLVGEGFAGDVHDPRGRVVSLDRVADGVHQVRFAQSNASVQEQRVIGCSRILRNSERRGVRKMIGPADHECFKRIFRVQCKYIDGFRADGIDIDVAIFRQDDANVRDGFVCRLDRVTQIIKIEVFQCFLDIRRGHFED